jgi:hypothetical protein
VVQGETGDRRRERGDRRREKGERRREMGEGRWEMGERRREMGEGRWEMGERREKREQDDSEKKAPLSITDVPMERSALKTVALFPLPCSSGLPSPFSFLPSFSPAVIP